MKKILFSLFITSFFVTELSAVVADCDAQFEFSVDGMTVYFTDASTADPGPIIGWTWDFGDGTTSTLENPVHTYAEPGEYDVCLTIHADGGCYDDKCESNIPVGAGEPTCDAEFEWSGAELTINFFDASEADAAIVGYLWDFDDGTTSNDENPEHTFPAPGVYEVCLTIETEGFDEACTSTTCHVVIVGGIGPDCSASFDYEVDGSTVYFESSTDPGPGDVESYSWDFGDGTEGDGANPIHEYDAGSYIVCFTVVFADGCTATYCDDILIEGGGDDCNVSAEVIGAEGMSKHFFASVEPEFDEVTYTWTFGDGTVYTEITAGGPSDPWHEYAEPGVYIVCVTIETGGGCIDSYCFEVEVGDGDCNAAFEWETDGLTVHFFNGSTGTGEASYEWYFGDGGDSNVEDPIHTYEPGSYVVCLVVTYTTDDGECVDEICYEISIGGGGDCESDFEWEGEGMTIHFFETATGTGDVSYSWDFGDGSSSDDANPVHEYDEPGIYTVCLLVTYEDGGEICSALTCYDVEVGEGGDCESDFEFDADGLTVHFFETASGEVIHYFWDFGDGEVSDDANPTHEYAIPGTYVVCLTIETAGGCEDTFCWEVTITEGGGDCESDFEFDEDGLTVHFFETADGGGADIISYLWTFGDGGTSDDANPTHIYDVPGTYVVCLTIITGDGCTSTYCDEITIEGGDGDCEAYFEITSMELIPDGWIVNFNNESEADGDITSVTWYFGDGTTAETFDAEHLYTEPGTYVVCLVITTIDGCTDEYCDEIVIEGGDECEADFDWEEDGLTVTFTEDADGGGADILSYLWTFDDGEVGFGPEVTHTYDVAGEYEVCLTIVTFDSCIDTHCEWINIEGGGIPCEAGFEIESIEETDLGWVVNFTNTSTGSDNYAWTFGDGGESDAENPEHLYEEPGIYLICLTIGEAGTDCFDEYCEEIFVGGDDDCMDATLIDSAFSCPEVYEPVCGCDGVTYDNACFAEHYGGILFWTEGTCATTIQEENIFGVMSIHPNPAQTSATISYVVQMAADVRIDITDITGRNITAPVLQQSVAGSYQFVLDTHDFASGIYLVKISGGGDAETQKLIITK